MAPNEPGEAATPKTEKKHKKDKISKSEKKRIRDEDDTGVEGERKHKKSKSVIVEDATTTAPEPQNLEHVLERDADGKKKKKKKDKKHATDDGAVQPVEAVPPVEQEVKSEKKKKKKQRENQDEQTKKDLTKIEEESQMAAVGEEKKKKKHKKSKDISTETGEQEVSEKKKKKKKTKSEPEADADMKIPASEAESELPPPAEDVDAMDVDADSKPPTSSKSSNIYQPPDIPADPRFPFFTQTVSLYEPLYPLGWAEPVTSAEYQYLRHLQNKYVPSLRGVLLNYRNVCFGEDPGRKGAASADDEPSRVLSKNEYAVGFGWITADVDLFVPSRGAWMEGSVNLQTEGHIGVVCFGRFNASIEARRLPPSWHWVPNESNDGAGFDETASLVTADDHGVVRQIHSTGYWADENGQKVKGKIRFRIRNFDVGTSGEMSYLSLEGTMLDRKSERALVEEEGKTAKQRREKRSGSHRVERRRLPEFSMTRFQDEAEHAQEGELNEAREA